MGAGGFFGLSPLDAIGASPRAVTTVDICKCGQKPTGGRGGFPPLHPSLTPCPSRNHYSSGERTIVSQPGMSLQLILHL